MIFLGTVGLLAILLTVGVARFAVSRWPDMSGAGHVVVSAASLPVAAMLIAIVMIVHTILQRTGPPDEGPLGMIVFALLMFWMVAVGIGVAIGIPTAIVAVKAFRR